MKKQFIKLNDNDSHLSFGNLCRIIKNISKAKTSAMQIEIFCMLFNVDNINDTTVNNYCVGCRSINDEYKQVYLNYQKKYSQDNTVLIPTICNLLSIIDGNLINNYSLNTINSNSSLKLLCNKLYNLAKNDRSCSEDFSTNLYNLVNASNYYEAIVEILFFVILEKKQPIYETEVKKEIIETILSNTNISANDLEEYLNLKLNEGVNFNYMLKKLSDEGNAYACFELGMSEYNGYYMGYPRYIVAFKYFNTAALSNHATSYYMMGRMYYDKQIGDYKEYELDKAFEYIKKAYDLECTAATNFLGMMYNNGIYPITKNIDKAKKYFLDAASHNYAYAYNNLGKMYESTNEKKAYEYYKKSADLGESWACNKIAERYRLNNNYIDAYNYYQKAISVPIDTLRYYPYYNLAKYYYLNGNTDMEITSDEYKAIEYFKIASDNNIIEASIELLYIYSKKYKESKDNQFFKLIEDISNKIENHTKFNDEYKRIINNNLSLINKNKEINYDILKG